MKVKFTNKKLKIEFSKIISKTLAVYSFILTVVTINQIERIVILGAFVVFLAIKFLRLWYLANKRIQKKFKINETDVIIKYGNIFEQPGVKVIAFNEYFDTQVDDRLISSNSLNGIFINQYSKGRLYIDKKINEEIGLKKNIIEENVNRIYGGKTIKYKLGSICPIDDYFILAFSHFNDDNRAYISGEDYFSCLMHMWNEIDRYYSGRPIYITLLGSGITRFNDIRIKPQELLNYMLITFKASKIKYDAKSSLTIILNEKFIDEINLYDLDLKED